MSLLDVLSFAPKGKIGTMEIMASLEEIHSDTLQVTEHPVEFGAAITDHAYVRPKEVVIRCGWSNSTLSGLLSSVTSLLGKSEPKTPSKFSSEMAASGYIATVYDYLLSLQDSRVPFSVMTSKRQYKNMLLTSLQVTNDQHTNAVLMVQATCRQIIIVKTKLSTVPTKENQASPKKTASLMDKGVSALKSAIPPAASSAISKASSLASSASSIASTAGSISAGVGAASSLASKFG